MTTVEPDEVHDDRPRRLARPHGRRARRPVARRQRRRRGGGHRRPGRPAAQPQPGAARRPRPAPPPCPRRLVHPHRHQHRVPARRALADPTGHRPGHPPAPAVGRRQPAALAQRRARRAGGHRHRGADLQRVPAPPRAGGPGRGARRAGAALPALPADEHGLPRALHLGAGDLPADLRRGGDRGPARQRPHQPDHLGAAHRRHRGGPALDGPAPRARHAGLVPRDHA